MSELEALKKENEELKKEVDELNKALSSTMEKEKKLTVEAFKQVLRFGNQNAEISKLGMENGQQCICFFIYFLISAVTIVVLFLEIVGPLGNKDDEDCWTIVGADDDEYDDEYDADDETYF